MTPRPQRFLFGRYRAFINVSHVGLRLGPEDTFQALFRGAFVSRRRRVFVSGGAWKPAGLARSVLSVRELARKDGKGRRANRRQAIPGLAGFRGRRGSAQPRTLCDLCVLCGLNQPRLLIFDLKNMPHMHIIDDNFMHRRRKNDGNKA